jgi:uncharacterized protein (DUF2236 family)
VTVTERLNAERVTILGWGRAILLQLAHPLVAQGVADHSDFHASALTRVKRLHSTIEAMLALTFGSPSQVAQAAARINGIHDRVHGQLPESVDAYRAGTPYTATDPALLRWVHATLLESIPLAYELFVGPLTRDELDRYCAEGAATAALLRLPPETLWRSRAELDAYLADMHASGRIAISSVARRLAREVATPPGRFATWPAGEIHRLATIGLLPPAVRDAYGFRWDARQDEALARWARRVRGLRRHAPGWLAQWPAARRPRS